MDPSLAATCRGPTSHWPATWSTRSSSKRLRQARRSPTFESRPTESGPLGMGTSGGPSSAAHRAPDPPRRPGLRGEPASAARFRRALGVPGRLTSATPRPRPRSAGPGSAAISPARPSTSRRYGPHKRLRANPHLRRRTAEGRYRHREHSCAGRPNHPPGQTDIATFARTLVGEPLWKHQLEAARSTARTR
jgi:hypothetical protein